MKKTTDIPLSKSPAKNMPDISSIVKEKIANSDISHKVQTEFRCRKH